MFCTHCKYTSFDYLPSCPRCGRDWSQSKKALNLDWVTASAAESKYQRQASGNAGSPPQAASNSSPASGTHTASGTHAWPPSPQQQETASSEPPSRPQEMRAQSQAPPMSPESEPDSTEEELDFPDLDSRLERETGAGSQDNQLHPSQAPQPDQEPAGSSLSMAGQGEEDEVLDLGSLVHDLGLEPEPEGSNAGDRSKTPRPSDPTGRHLSPDED